MADKHTVLYVTQIAKRYRQRYLESKNGNRKPSDFAITMSNPENLAPILLQVYNRMQRNRQHYYLAPEDVQWDGALYDWFAEYWDTTSPHKPTMLEQLTGQVESLESIPEAQHHLMNKFNEEFGAMDTYHARNKHRIAKFQSMNGEDGDCYWSYMGATGGPHRRPLVVGSNVGDNIEGDFEVAKYIQDRQFVNNPAALYGARFRQQEAEAEAVHQTERTLFRDISPAPYMGDSLPTFHS